MKKLICGILVGLGLFFIVGTAGALDQDKISVSQFVARETCAFVGMCLSAWIGGFFE